MAQSDKVTLQRQQYGGGLVRGVCVCVRWSDKCELYPSHSVAPSSRLPNNLCAAALQEFQLFLMQSAAAAVTPRLCVCVVRTRLTVSVCVFAKSIRIHNEQLTLGKGTRLMSACTHTHAHSHTCTAVIGHIKKTFFF